MNIKNSALLLFIGLMLTGCNSLTPAASCSSSDTQKIIAQLITEQAAKLTADKKYDYYDGSFVFGGVKVRALLAQFQVAVENANTVKEDENSNEKLCNGLLKVTVPANTLAEANQAREIQHEPEIAVYAEQFNIENNANVFTQDVEYRVQLIGKANELHVDIEDAGWANVLDQIITSALLKPTLAIEVPDHVQLNKPPKQTAAPLKPELEPAKPATGQIESEADAFRAAKQKQGLEKLNKELSGAEQIKKEMLQERPSEQAATQQVYPSFNCSKAAKPTEVTICTHPDLAVLDVENSDLYAKAKSVDAVATKEIWKESIKSKYACGTDVDCIKAVYSRSIEYYRCVGDGNDPDCAGQ